MTEHAGKRAAHKAGSKAALAMAKKTARLELRQIFAAELKERESQRQQELSRAATASHPDM